MSVTVTEEQWRAIGITNANRILRLQQLEAEVGKLREAVGCLCRRSGPEEYRFVEAHCPVHGAVPLPEKTPMNELQQTENERVRWRERAFAAEEEAEKLREENRRLRANQRTGRIIHGDAPPEEPSHDG